MIVKEAEDSANKNYNDARKIISLIDLTSLNDDDNEASIVALCAKAKTVFGSVAAVCVYPKFVPIAYDKLRNTSVNIATVINFPNGNASLLEITNEIETALKNGANEIDIVFPYRIYLEEKKEKALSFIVKARELCKQNIKLKVIIETGALISIELIETISAAIIQAGADFIKTSTGKTKQGATLEAAAAILKTIRKQSDLNSHSVGIKISGGIRNISQAQSYIQLASEIMGSNWVHPNVFRIGASKLLDEIISKKNNINS